jgi:hypothetical protein
VSNTFAKPGEKIPPAGQPVFKVFRTNEPITIDGKMNESVWKNTKAHSIEYFYRIDKQGDIRKWRSAFHIDDFSCF